MRMLRLLSLFVVMLALIDACQNPLEGVKLRTKDPINTGVIELRLYDPAGNPLPKTSQVQLVGPDADKLVTTLNTNRYKVNADGVLLLAAMPGVVATAQKPLRFTVFVEADGYLTVVQPFTITNDSRVTRVVRWINLEKPPRTLAAGRIKGRAGADGAISGPMALLTPSPAGSEDKASVILEPGTQLTDRDGAPVDGDLTLTALYTNARDGALTSQVPGGGILWNVGALTTGTSLGTMRVTSLAGSITLEAFAREYRLAHASSQPINWRMDLNPNTINGKTGRPIQAGDRIPLYSYDAITNRWQEETPGQVVRTVTGGLEYQATATRLVAYVATWTDAVCDAGPVFSVSSKLANVDVNYLCKLVNVSTGQVISSFYANINNNALIRIYNQPSGLRLKLQVFDETDAWGKGAKGGLMAESGVAESCNQTPVGISLAALPVPPVMNLEFSFSCPGGTQLDESLLPSLIKTQYSEVGKENWRDLFSATRTERKVASYKIQVGRRYDFRASTDGGATWPLRENNYLVDKPEWSLKIRSEAYCK